MKLKKSMYLLLNLAFLLIIVFFVTLLKAGSADSEIKKVVIGKEYIITDTIAEEINKIISEMDIESFEKLVDDFAKSVEKEDINKEEIILNYYGKKGWNLHSRYREGQYIFER